MFRGLRSWLREYTRTQPATSVVFPPGTSLLQLQGFAPEKFSYGVEILNDDVTSCEFVTSTLQQHVGMGRRAAFLVAVNIHMKGGAILALESLEEAERLSELIVQSARAAQFPLVCRAISTQQRAAGDSRNARA
jgi:ATP-dependent Clp protease adapter protein ClpS